MLRSVEIKGFDETPYKIDIVKPDQTGLIISSIDGLGAGAAELTTSGRASMDGDVFNGARVGSRNIVFTFRHGRRQDPEVGRELSYNLFPLKEQVEMIFTTDKRTAMISGYVESNEPDIFTNEPSFTVSVMCVEQPYFKSVFDDQVTTKLYYLEPKLEFPLSNESLTAPLINMGEHHLDDYVDLRYEGSVRTGITVRFVFTAAGKNPGIMNERTRQSMRIDTAKITSLTGTAVSAGDVIEVCTVRGQKAVTLIREGVRRNVINALARTSQWIEILPGINPISIYTETGGTMPFQTEIIHDELYQGL